MGQDVRFQGAWGRQGWLGRSVAAAVLCAAAIASLLPSSPARAQSYTWGGTGSSTTTTNYNTATNWSTGLGGAPPIFPTQSAIFGSAGSATIAIGGGPMLPDSWTFNANSQSYTISGNEVDFSLSGTTGGLINHANTGQTITISTNVNDGGGGSVMVQQLGNSTLVLSGTNGYAGGTVISAGTVQVTNANSVGSGTITLDGGTFQMQSPTVSTIAFSNNIVVNAAGGTVDAAGAQVNLQGVIADGVGAGVLQLADSSGGFGVTILSGTNTYSGGTLVTGATVQVTNNSSVGTGTVTLNNSAFQADGLSNLTFTNNFKINNSANGSAIDTNGTTLTITGNITDGTGAGKLTVLDSSIGGGGIVVLDGANTYSGGTTICFCGTLQLGDTTHTGSIVGAVTNEGLFNIVNADTSGITSITNDGSSGVGITSFAAGTAGHATIVNEFGGSTVFLGSSSAGSANISNHDGGVTAFGLSGGNDISTAGNATISNNDGGTIFSGHTNAGTATITTRNFGGVLFDDQSSAVSATIINNNNGFTTFGSAFGTDTATAANANITNNSGGQTGFNAFTTAGNATITTNSGGSTYFYDNSTGGTAQFITSGTGLVDFSGSLGPNGDGRITAGSIAGSGFYYIGAGNTLIVGGNNLSTAVSGVIADTNPCGCGSPGSGALEKTGTGTLTLSGANTYSGGTTVNAGTLQLAGVGTLGAVTATTTVNAGGTLDLGSTTQTQAALKLAGGTLQNGNLNAPITSTGGTINNLGGSASLAITSGTTILTGIDNFTGGTTVSNATLTVNGLLSDPTINSGGFLNGIGSVGNTAIQSGGTFAPGNGTPGTSMTVAGNLALQSGAMYVVMLNSTSSSSANVTGTATLGGATVNAIYANGSYVSKQYTILTAGSVSGTFGTFTNTNLPTNFSTALSYDARNAYLNLTLNFTPTPPVTPPTTPPVTPPSSPPGPAAPSFGGLNFNQLNVGNALINFFNTTGGIPMVYGTLTPAGLTQASGELATASQQTTFDAMNLFLGLLTDPFMQRNGMPSPTPGASGYADEALGYAAAGKRDAYAMFTKAPPAPFVQRWSTWVAGYGGSQNTDGNAAAGSNNTTSSVYATAVGADYLFSPNTVAGFALAGGGTNFSVVNSGSGHSDLFQAGAYVRHTEGAAYISAALAYGWQDITTTRTVTAAGFDQLRAEFNANAYSGRVEGGYRFVAPWTGGVGITPYAAGQFTTFDLPSYAESVLSGAGTFALGYGAKGVTDARSELGFRTDKSWAMPNGVLTLRSRFAWAHDFDPDRSIGATFQALPGASFVVNGAAQAHDSALTTASLEMKWMNGWSAAATFEGEFSDVTSSYAGKGVVRYQW